MCVKNTLSIPFPTSKVNKDEDSLGTFSHSGSVCEFTLCAKQSGNWF